MSEITVERKTLPGDERIGFDPHSRTIFIDTSDLSDAEIEDVAQIAALAVSALLPGVSMTPKQAQILVNILLKVVEIMEANIE